MNNLADTFELHTYIDGLNIKETKFVAELLCHGSIQKAGENAGITRSTAYKWASNEKISNALNSLRKDLALQSLCRSKLFLNTAVDKVFNLMNDEDAPKSIQLNSAKILIELAERSIEKTDIIDRINDLEKSCGEEE